MPSEPPDPVAPRLAPPMQSGWSLRRDAQVLSVNSCAVICMPPPHTDAFFMHRVAFRHDASMHMRGHIVTDRNVTHEKRIRVGRDIPLPEMCGERHMIVVGCNRAAEYQNTDTLVYATCIARGAGSVPKLEGQEHFLAIFIHARP